MAIKKIKAGPILALLLLFGPAFLLILISGRKCEHKFKQLEDYGQVPTFSFTDISGKKYTNKDFIGQITVISTIQPTCPDSCAIDLWQVDQQIYQLLAQNKTKLRHIKLISFVTDGLGNPSNRLQDVQFTLKDRVQNYDPSIWMLANGDARAAYDLKSNGTSLLHKGKEFYGGEAFQELLLLIDKKGHLRMVLSGKSEAMVRTMKQHIALLEKEYDKEAWNKRK